MAQLMLCTSSVTEEREPSFTVGGQLFKVRREGREAGLFSVWSHDTKCAGYFSVELMTGAITIRGRYTNVLESPDDLIAVAEQFLASPQAIDDGALPRETASGVRLRDGSLCLEKRERA
jgi:hypothetical protein